MAPAFIVLCSTWAGFTNNYQVRLGQAKVVCHSLGIYAGPDRHSIGPSSRDIGGVHFDTDGTIHHATLWDDVIAGHFGL